jgi:hypothetical protein
MPDRSMDAPRVKPRGRKRLILLGFLALAGVLIAITGRYVVARTIAARSKPPTALIRVLKQTPVLMPGRAVEPPEDFESYRNSQAQLIRSNYVCGPALRSPKVSQLPLVAKQSDPGDWLAELIQVTVVPESEIIRVSIDLPDRDQAQALLHAVMDSYIETVIEDERNRQHKRLETLQKIWQTHQSDLKSKRKAIRELSSVVGTSDKPEIEIPRAMNLEDLRASRTDLRKIRLDKVAAETRLARRKGEKTATPLETAAIEETVATLAAQEKFLQSNEAKTLEWIVRQQSQVMDLDQERDEIKALHDSASKIAEEIQTLEVNLDAPQRIMVLTKG